MRRWIAAAAVVLLFGAGMPAQAHERFFTRTYDWFTPSQGEKELELWWTQKDGGEADAQIEFEYGVTSRYVLAPYLLMKREHGGDFAVEGWKLEQRYRFGEYGRHRFMPALYLEVKKENHASFELEGKIITTYLFGDRWIWSSNLIAESAVDGPSKVELGYATGISHPVTPRLGAGLELFGNWTEHEHFFGPTLTYQVGRGTKVLLNAGFRYDGGEGGSVRLMFEKEWR